MAGNADFNAILSTTLRNYRKQLVDNIFSARPLTWFLMRKDKIRMEDGGESIVIPLMYGKSGATGSYSGYDTLSLAPQEGITSAKYDWKQFYASVSFDGLSELKNAGENRVINLLKSKITQAEESMKDAFNVMLYANGTGNSGKDWNGLGNLIESTTGTVGGIDRSANSWWNAYEENTSTALTLALMTTAYNTVSKGNDHPDFAITTQTLFEKYESLLIANLRYQDVATANAGFQNLLFKQIPIVFDADCTAGVVYFLNTKYIELVGHSDKWFKQGDFKTPEDVDAKFSLLLTAGNLVLSNAARQGKLTAKTA